MTKNIYSIYDIVAETFNTPFPSLNNATAIRDFETSVIKEQHKNDYALYYLGTYDQDNGKLEGPDNPVRLITGLDIKDQTNEVPVTLKEQAI